jgi:hypothetical protein
VAGKLGAFGPARASIVACLREREPHRDEQDLAAHAGDHEFMASTLDLRDDDVIRVPIAVYVVRPERNRWRRIRYRLKLRKRLTGLDIRNRSGRRR